MRHGTLTVITRLRPGSRKEVEACLARLEQAHAPFLRDLPELHYARWLTLDLTPRGASDTSRELHLLFAADFTLEDSEPPLADETRLHRQDAALAALDARFLSLLVEHLVEDRRRHRGQSDFDALYRHCEGYAPGLDAPDHIRDWMFRHSVDCNARHVELVYRVETAQGLRNLVDLHLGAERYLRQARPLLEGTPDRVLLERSQELRGLRSRDGTPLQALRDPGWVETKLRPARLEATWASVVAPVAYARYLPPLKVFKYVKAALDLGADIVSGVKALGRRLAWSALGLPAPDVPIRPAPIPQEDPEHVVQLSLSLCSPIRSGPLGLRQVELAMKLVNARLQRYVVGLNEIQTVHCARWLLYSPPPRDGVASEPFLIFLATYDNSWEDYIDAFVDNKKVQQFLVAIWRHTEGFPAQGPRLPFTPRRPFVEPFKQWIRSIEVPTRVAYSAYLHGPPPPQPASVLNLHSALLLRELLGGAGRERPWSNPRSPEVRALTAFLSGGVCPVGRPFQPWLSAAWSLLKDRAASRWRREPIPLSPPLSPPSEGAAFA